MRMRDAQINSVTKDFNIPLKVTVSPFFIDVLKVRTRNFEHCVNAFVLSTLYKYRHIKRRRKL